MAERAQLFDDADDFDISAFAPKKTKDPAPPPEAIRAVSEGASFMSREPVHSASAEKSNKKPRRRRTGRNLQLNLKVSSTTLESFYELADSHGWVLGEAFEHALAALKKELAAKS